MMVDLTLPIWRARVDCMAAGLWSSSDQPVYLSGHPACGDGRRAAYDARRAACDLGLADYGERRIIVSRAVRRLLVTQRFAEARRAHHAWRRRLARRAA